MNYNDLYEMLRKEKYAETLQVLGKKFILDFCDYLKELRKHSESEGDLFAESDFQSKKQLENSISLFKGLILRRKKKLLNLVFIAAETGIMKKEFDNMLDFEKKIFESLIKAFEEGDKELSAIMNGKNGEKVEEKTKMIIFNESIEEFVDMNGKIIGPYSKGDLVNLDSKVGEILVGGGKATYVDED